MSQANEASGISWGQEVMASVVVFLVALPLCMGIAVACKVPPALGLFTGIIGGIIVGFMAGSPLQVSGPAAGLVVLVVDAVEKFGLKALGVIVLGAGLVQLLAGVSRVGRWFRAVAPAVIYGMLAGIGVIIFASQFHIMVDDKPVKSALMNLLSIPGAIYKGVLPLDGSTHHMAAGIGLLCIIVLVVWNFVRGRLEKAAAKDEEASSPVLFLRFLPAPLLAVIIGTAATILLKFPIQKVKIPAKLLDSLNIPFVGNWTNFTTTGVFASVGTMASESFALLAKGEIIVAILATALIASAESLLCASAVDKLHQGVRTNYDKELAAQGIGNILCGLIGALPMTGVIVRSSANVAAGAKTRYSAILHGVWLLAFIIAFPALLALIPKAALAAILVYIGYKLVNFNTIKDLWKTSKSEFGIYMATLIVIVSFGLLKGVVVGFTLSVMKLIYNFTHVEIDVSKREDEENVYDIDLHGALTFVRMPDLAETLEALPTDAEIHIHLGALQHIDHACIEFLCSWDEQIETAGGSLIVEWDTLRRKFNDRPIEAVKQNMDARNTTMPPTDSKASA